jgi:hypothetical protein
MILRGWFWQFTKPFGPLGVSYLRSIILFYVLTTQIIARTRVGSFFSYLQGAPQCKRTSTFVEYIETELCRIDLFDLFSRFVTPDISLLNLVLVLLAISWCLLCRQYPSNYNKNRFSHCRTLIPCPTYTAPVPPSPFHTIPSNQSPLEIGFLSHLT